MQQRGKGRKPWDACCQGSKGLRNNGHSGAGELKSLETGISLPEDAWYPSEKYLPLSQSEYNEAAPYAAVWGHAAAAVGGALGILQTVTRNYVPRRERGY
jgi:hypothetical protein